MKSLEKNEDDIQDFQKARELEHDNKRMADVQKFLVQGIFDELIFDKKMPYITEEIFANLIWDSNIHKTCVVKFDDSDED